MLKIGELSKLSRISVRMLRHYDEIGLLKPAEIDRFTVGGRSSFRDGTPSQRGEPLRVGTCYTRFFIARHSEPVRTLAWESASPRGQPGKAHSTGLTRPKGETDCHTSDIGQKVNCRKRQTDCHVASLLAMTGEPFAAREAGLLSYSFWKRK